MQEYTETFPDFPEELEQEQTQPELFTIEQAQALLAEKHKVIVDEQDGLLMLVTLHRAFLNDYNRLLTAHSEKLESFQNQASEDLDEKAKLLQGGIEVVMSNFFAEHLNPLIGKIEEIQKEQQRPAPAQSQGIGPIGLGMLGLCCLCVLLLTLKITGVL